MSQNHPKNATEDAPEQGVPPDSIFARKLTEDRWEAWTYTAVGLLGCVIPLWIVALLKLGYMSIYAFSVGIPLTGYMALLVVTWGLVRSLLNPPTFRRSRTIGFGALLLVGLSANMRLLPAPVSTSAWTSKHDYRLPFDGAWTTLTGGGELKTSYLASAPATRYGYAFTVVKDGKRHQGSGDRVEDYHCLGQPILAPADGVVQAALNTIKDNAPGKTNDTIYSGNYVALKIDEGEVFFAFFLQEGSVPVKVGDKLKRGDVIGACGSSGAATLPHVQVHLQNSAKYPMAEGLPLRFDYLRGASGQELVEGGMPRGVSEVDDLSGEVVRPYLPTR